MFADLVGFTDLAHADEPAALALVAELESVAATAIKKHRGRKVKSMGDGLLVEFPDALDAVQCAVELQTSLSERNVREGVTPLHLRVGLHLGDVERKGSDIVGDAVNLASRVEPFAEPGGVCLSEHVALQVRNKLPYRFEAIGPKTLKGIREPVVLYRVVLPWTSGAAPAVSAGPPRIAVLPLANISPDPRDEYFADGLTDELISVLSRLHGLRVIARTSVGQYKSTTKTIRQVGAELGVSALLEGSVRRAGDRLRVTLQLIDAASEEHRWAETYDRNLNDIFEIQAEIAGRTAEALQVEFLGSDQAALRRSPVKNIDAYEPYLRGIVAFERAVDEGWTRRATEVAAQYLEAAVAKDPRSAAARATLANLYIHAQGESLSKSVVEPKARQLVAAALRLDPQEPEVRTASGNLALQVDHDWARAEQEFRTAIALNPSAISAHIWLGILLHALGRYSESVGELRAASELDPLYVNPIIWQMRSLDRSGDTAGAIALAERTLERMPGDSSLWVERAGLLLHVGRREEALRETESSPRPQGGVRQIARWAVVLAMLGRESEARSLIEESLRGSAGATYFPPSIVAELYASLGETDEALGMLERDAREGDESLWIIFRRRVFDSIRSDPRFVALAKQVNLPN
jgi:adenylate cyclase